MLACSSKSLSIQCGEQTAGEVQEGWEEAEAEAEANSPCLPGCEEPVPVLLAERC